MQAAQEIATQAIGAPWPGATDIYAGYARGRDGAPDYILLVVTGEGSELEGATWTDAAAWAKRIGDDLPTRRELSLLYANVPELFAEKWHWSGEQYAGYDACAWAQSFGFGGQYTCHKSDKLRARAVRRLTI